MKVDGMGPNPLQPLSGRPPSAQPLKETGNTAFDGVLGEELKKASALRFSAHAAKRLTERGLEFNAADLRSIETAVAQAAAKGGKETLVITERAGLIVNVPDRTVITAVPRKDLAGAVFTNIDSAVVAGSAKPPLPNLG